MSENINNEETSKHEDGGASFKPPRELQLIGNICHNYQEFEKSFKIYMAATGFNKLEEENRKISILLNLIGEDAVQIYEAHQLQGETLEEVLTNFRNYFKPKKRTILYRCRFLSARQEEEEKIEAYVTRLKTLSAPCDFGEQTEPLLRDKLVLGIRSKKLQETLLSMTELTLKVAVEICQAWETGKSLRKEIISNESTNRQDLVEEISNKNNIKKINVNGIKRDLNNKSGQLNFELDQHPQFQQLFQNYFAQKLNHYSEMSGKEIGSKKKQVQSSEINALENFFRNISVNSQLDFDQDTESESADSDTSDESYEENCENLVSFLLPQIDFSESDSKNSVGKSTSKGTLPFEKDEKERSDLKYSTQDFTEGRLNTPMNFINRTGKLECRVCQWIPPDQSVETFLAHCKTPAHRFILAARFPESQGVKVESKGCVNNEKQKDSSRTLSIENFYNPKVSSVHPDELQRQNVAQNAQECQKVQQAHPNFKAPGQPLPQQPIKQEVQTVEKAKKKKKKKEKQEQTVLNSAQESKASGVPSSENKKQVTQSEKQSTQKETKATKTLNLKFYALAKGMASVQAHSEKSLVCETCNKQIPSSQNFDSLMKSLLMHLQSKKHLQKLVKTEDKLKTLLLENPEPENAGSLDKKVMSPKDQSSLSINKASAGQEKTVPESKKAQKAATKQEKVQTDNSVTRFLCLQCNFSNSTFEEFGRHLESEHHLSTCTAEGVLRAKNPECTECSSCKTYLFGTLFEMNVHFSKCFKKKG